MSLATWISGLFGPAEADTKAGAAHPQLPKALNIAALPAKLQASNLQIIGLQGIRDSLSDSWPEKRNSILQIADSVIRRCLDPGDAHYHLDTDDYLVLFLHLNHAQAKAKAAIIASEMRRLILGEVPDSNIEVMSHVAEIDSAFINSKIASLQDLVQHVKNASDQPSGNVELFASGTETMIDFSSAGSTGGVAPMMGAGPDLADLDQSLNALFQKKKSASYLKECQAAFYPNFSTRRRAFSFYTVAVTHVPTNRPADSSDPMLEDPEELEFLLDRYRLTTALLGLHRMVTGGHQGVIIIPVSFQTLATSKNRGIFLSRFHDLPRGLFRSLCITIGNIPHGTPASRITDAINYIQPFCASRLIRIAPDVKLMDLYAQTGTQGFETALPTDIADPELRHAALTAFARRAAWHKMESLLSGVNSAEDLRMGNAAGYNFLIGDAVAPLIATPGHRQALRADHIPQRAGPAPVAAPAAVAHPAQSLMTG